MSFPCDTCAREDCPNSQQAYIYQMGCLYDDPTCNMHVPKHYPVMVIPEPLERMLWRLELNYRRARHNAPENVRRRARYKSKAKWRKGRVVKSLDELYAQQQVYWRGRFCHCGWFRSWQFRYAKSEVDKGNIRLCLPREK